MNTETKTAPTKATLSTATSLLFHIAARSHTLAELFGIERLPLEIAGEEPKITFYQRERPWLTQHPRKSGDGRVQLTFDPDRFAGQLGVCSSGTRHMILFILNVWNPGYAKSKGWDFNLFDALNSLDEGNRQAIAWWLHRPLWP
jgi:hypothetical protein